MGLFEDWAAQGRAKQSRDRATMEGYGDRELTDQEAYEKYGWRAADTERQYNGQSGQGIFETPPAPAEPTPLPDPSMLGGGMGALNSPLGAIGRIAGGSKEALPGSEFAQSDQEDEERRRREEARLRSILTMRPLL